MELRHLPYFLAVAEMENISRPLRISCTFLSLDDISAVISAIEAGKGVSLASNFFGYTVGRRLKLLRLPPEPKPVAFGIAAPKGRLSLAAEKF